MSDAKPQSSPRLYVRPRETALLSALAVALLLITAVAFDGLANLVSGVLIVVAFVAAGRIRPVSRAYLANELGCSRLRGVLRNRRPRWPAFWSATV